MKYLRIEVQSEPMDPVHPVELLIDGRASTPTDLAVARGDSFELSGPRPTTGGRSQSVTVSLQRRALDAAQIAAWIRQDTSRAAAAAGVDIDQVELARQADRLARRATSLFRFFRRH